MSKAQEFLINAYAAFNARDIEAVLALMHPDVKWPNGMEGGWVHGTQEVRDYWTRQFQMITPYVEPQHYHTDEAGRIVVTVHQVIHDKAGNLLIDQLVTHAYQIEDDLIRTMEIGKPAS